jgi:hypothetical protein
VFGFFTFDAKRDPNPPWGPSFEGAIVSNGIRVVHVDSFGRASLYENASDSKCELVRTVSSPVKRDAKRSLRFHMVALSSTGWLAASCPERRGVEHLCLFAADGAHKRSIPLCRVRALAWTTSETLVLIDEHMLCCWAPGLGPVLEFYPALGTSYEVLDAARSVLVTGSSDGSLSVWTAGALSALSSRHGLRSSSPLTQPLAHYPP